jgi:hypothetical protein
MRSDVLTSIKKKKEGRKEKNMGNSSDTSQNGN